MATNTNCCNSVYSMDNYGDMVDIDDSMDSNQEKNSHYGSTFHTCFRKAL